jgi:hypothetical protein
MMEKENDLGGKGKETKIRPRSSMELNKKDIGIRVLRVLREEGDE